MPKYVSRCQKVKDPHWKPPKEYTKEERCILEDWMLIESVAWVQTYADTFSRVIYIQAYLSDRFGISYPLDLLTDRLNRLDGIVFYRHRLPSYNAIYTEYWIHPDWMRRPYNRYYLPEERERLRMIMSNNARLTEEYRLERNRKKREHDRKLRAEKD